VTKHIKKQPTLIFPKKTVIAYKKTDFSFVDCNDSFLLYAGVSNKDKILGLNDYDLVWSKYADNYRKQDKDALEGNHYSTLVPFQDHEGNEMVFFKTKLQWINEKKEIIGVVSYAIDVTSPRSLKIINLLYKTDSGNRSHNYSIGKKHLSTLLSDRESECLFYLIRGKTAKSIAEILGLSFRTVEHHIDGLKLKFNCSCKSELINSAISEGFVEIIPNAIFFRNLLLGLED